MLVYNINSTSQYNPQTQCNPSFEAILIRQINPSYSNIQKKIIKELENFTKKQDNAELLGKGITASVYKFKKLQDIVFKKSLKDSNRFDNEIKNLQHVPNSIKNVQKFIAQAFDDETGIFYLLSTKMRGKEANWKDNPWTKKGLRSLFNTLFQLDKNGIYHGDLHCGNILLDNNGRASLIDFQWTQIINKKRFFENNPNSFMPPFIMNENAQMFEMASIPYYLKFAPDMEKGKSFFKNYLIEKSKYHEKRSNYLRNLIKDWPYDYENETILKGINYEDSQSVLFRNPDDDILNLEAKKIQFLSCFRETLGKIDKNNPTRDFITAASSQLITLSAIKELKKEIVVQKSQNLISDVKKSYLEITDEYANYWYNNIKSWIDVVFDDSIKAAENSGHNPLKKYKPESTTNIFNYIDESYKSEYTRDFGITESPLNKTNIKDIEKQTEKLQEISFNFEFEPKIIKKINEIKKINNKLQKALENDWGLDVINFSILNLAKNRELKAIFVQKRDISQNLRDEIITLLHLSKENYKNIAERNYKHILKMISSDNNVQLSGYKGMHNFE